jgi:polyphenol oxidase
MATPAAWITPDWRVPPNVRSTCTTRDGGVSQGRYDSLNLGDHVGDEGPLVAQNRAIFERAIGARPVYMKQVHGTAGVVRLDGHTEDGVEGDGCWSSVRRVACTIMVADCLPVLFAVDDGSRVGAAHAGWRGLAGGIVEATVHAMGVPPSSLLAWLGPCIGPEAFEVGPEVKAAFDAGDPAASAHFKAHGEGKWLANLPALTRQRLARLGVTRLHGNDGSAQWCTVSNPSRFFSHRRDRVSGRLAASVWLA